MAQFVGRALRPVCKVSRRAAAPSIVSPAPSSSSATADLGFDNRRSACEELEDIDLPRFPRAFGVDDTDAAFGGDGDGGDDPSIVLDVLVCGAGPAGPLRRRGVRGGALRRRRRPRAAWRLAEQLRHLGRRGRSAGRRLVGQSVIGPEILFLRARAQKERELRSKPA